MHGHDKEYVGREVNWKYNFSSHKNLSKELTSSDYSIKFVRKGVENYTSTSNQISLEANEIIICKPNEQVFANVNTKNYTDGVCIYLPKGFFENKKGFFDLIQIFPSFKLSVVDTELAFFYKNINSQLDADTTLNRFYIYFKSFLNSKFNKLNNLEVSKKDTSLQLWNNLEQSKIFILNNFQNQVKLEDIADSACMSKFHFQRVFKKFYNTSPNQYLNRTRLNHALNLLNQNNSDVLDITFQCGFNDVKYFKKCLKKTSNFIN